ncbi:MAG: hypothetical protein WDA65_06130 [Christensenellales bacterium]
MQCAQRKYDYTYAPNINKKRKVNMRGNVAYINNNNFLCESGSSNGRQKPAVKKTGVYKRPAPVRVTDCVQKKRKGLASTLTVIFIGFCALALLVSRHAEIVRIGLQNNELTQKISALETKAEDLKLEMELRGTLESVAATARQRLGMTYPLNNQRMNIDLNGG